MTIKYPKTTKKEVTETCFKIFDVFRDKYGKEYMALIKADDTRDNCLTASLTILVIGLIATCMSLIFIEQTFIPIIISGAVMLCAAIAFVIFMNWSIDSYYAFASKIAKEFSNQIGIKIYGSDMSNILNLDKNYKEIGTHYGDFDLYDYITELERFKAQRESYNNFKLESCDNSEAIKIYGYINDLQYGEPLYLKLKPVELKKVIATDNVYDFSFIDGMYADLVASINEYDRDKS